MWKTAALAALLLAGCTGEPETPAPKLSRVDAVAAAPVGAATVNAFCEVKADAETANPLVLPELDTPAPAPASGWTWWNIWATWCAPCVAEMPLLKGWEKKLNEEGANLAVRFLSVDDKQADVDSFRAKHPTVPDGVRIKLFSSLGGWLPGIGLDATAAIPIHILVDPAQKVRCVRMGAVGAADYPTIKAIVTGK